MEFNSSTVSFASQTTFCVWELDDSGYTLSFSWQRRVPPPMCFACRRASPIELRVLYSSSVGLVCLRLVCTLVVIADKVLSGCIPSGDPVYLCRSSYPLVILCTFVDLTPSGDPVSLCRCFVSVPSSCATLRWSCEHHCGILYLLWATCFSHPSCVPSLVL